MGHSEDDDVRRATEGFYTALDDLCLGKGDQAMSDAWVHADYVSTVHPLGHWARGWKEVWATWQEIAAVWSFYKGHAGRTDRMSNIHDLKVSVLRDSAFTVSIFRSKMYMPEGKIIGLNVNCTNVLEKTAAGWKVVHHHPDQATPEFVAEIQKMVEAAQR
jgi:ketosteroid isomerase-like protein